MGKDEKYKLVSARLPLSKVERLEKSGKNPREAIDYWLEDYYSKNPRKRIRFEIKEKEEEMKKLQKQIEKLQNQYDDLKEEVDELKLSLSGFETSLEELEDVDLKEFVKRIQNIFIRTFVNKMLVSPSKSKEENIEEFIQEKKEIINNVSNEFFVGKYSEDEINKILLDYLVIP